MIVVKFELRFLDDEAVGERDKARPIGRATKFAVGSQTQPDFLLQFHHVADGVVLNLPELRFVDRLRRKLLERLAQRGRAQQAADVVGAKRGTAIGGNRHG